MYRYCLKNLQNRKIDIGSFQSLYGFPFPKFPRVLAFRLFELFGFTLFPIFPTVYFVQLSGNTNILDKIAKLESIC